MTNGYALGQLSNALLTAAAHEDRAVRRRADRRAGRWMQVLDGLAAGDLRLRSRTPVAGLHGSLYAWKRSSAPTLTFSGLCRTRAGSPAVRGWSVAANGTVIEQSQLLTTHNLAALVGIGVQPNRSWSDLADAALAQVASMLDLAAPLSPSTAPQRSPTIRAAVCEACRPPG